MSWLTDIKDKLCCLDRRATTLETDVDALEESVALLEGPYSDARLKEIVSAEGYELTAITRDADEVPTTATVKWPDGTSGVFTTTTKNVTWLAVDAFTVTYVGGISKTITQPSVTRNASGAVTVKPALTVS